MDWQPIETAPKDGTVLMDEDQLIFEAHAENHRHMHSVEKERCAAVNKCLNKEAFEIAWDAFQRTSFDLLADSDDQTCKCVHNAVAAYMTAQPDNDNPMEPHPRMVGQS